jgi:hypothetical protein
MIPPNPFRQLCAVAIVLLLIFTERAKADAAAPSLDFDAARLSAGRLAEWTDAYGEKIFVENGAGDAKPPTVVELAGRRAVSFAGAMPLQSSAAVNEALVRGKPFTLAVSVYLPASTKRQVIAAWASRPNGTAEFSCGPQEDGAFFGWDQRVRYTKSPAPGAWHELAWSYEQSELRVYVDGQLDASVPGKLNIKPGGRLLIGAGWDSAGKKPIFPFEGGVARLRIWTRALSHQEIRNAAGLSRAFAAAPADGATAAVEALKLHWEPGAEAAKAYEVRSGQTPDALAQAKPQRTTAPELALNGIVPGAKVFWRVDQLDAEGKPIEPGDVWTFTADTGPAAAPTPRDHVANVPRKLASLRWTPGRYATAQKLFWGRDADAVAKGAVPPVALDAKTQIYELPASGLEFGKTYYWRVEEINGSIPSAPGAVWAFRTEDAIEAGDVTFFVGSDTHYGNANNAEINRKVIDQMNWLPGTPMPDKAGGGIVKTPRGVILDGDLLDKGFDPTAPSFWKEFTQDYGLTGTDGRLAYPLYEGFGNHDGMTGKSTSRAGIKERNPKRVGLTGIAPNGFHYSWDWDQVHLVQLNLFPGNDSADCVVGPPNHHPEHALQFLQEDLAKNVGQSGKVVIVFCHYCYSGGMADWWTEPAKQRFRDAVKGYRTLLVHGHSHGAYFYEWKGLRAISDGSCARPESQTGDFLVVHITRDKLYVAQRKLGEWGITLAEPLPATDRIVADRDAAATGPAK